MSIPDFLKDPDWMCFAAGFIFLILGLFTPKRFAGVEMDWSSARSLTAILLGAILLVISYPQLRFWQSNTVNVDRALIATLTTDAQKGLDSINAARR